VNSEKTLERMFQEATRREAFCLRGMRTSRYPSLYKIDLAHRSKKKITGSALETIAMTYNASKMFSPAILE
jgi:hypothetical protein